MSRLRIYSILLLVILFPVTLYLLWSPGMQVTDGRHDRASNGIWLQHGWLGDDAWFQRNLRNPELFRENLPIQRLAIRLKHHRIRYVFPHACPSSPEGDVSPVDPLQTERFLDAFHEFDVLPWIGGVYGKHCFPDVPGWRARFVRSAVSLLERHPRFKGVHVNIEPMPSGHVGFLLLLEELRAALPPEKRISIAAYPPPTRWHPHPDVHWDESYFRAVAARADQMVPMLYDTAIRYPKFYEQLVTSWTREVLAWSGESEVLLGLPAYDDAGAGYHDPRVENLVHALRGVHRALSATSPLPANYAGIALYSEWEMEPGEWEHLRENFIRR